MMNSSIKSLTYPHSANIPNSLVYLQSICFSILFGIWVLPETILIRHICLILGALIGLYVIFQNRALFLKREALPIGLLCLLFAWALFHLFFLGQDFEAQWLEWTTIWKRAAIGLVFAIGFGISLVDQAKDGTVKRVKTSWWIVFGGLALPTIFFWIKWFLGILAYRYGLEFPDYLRLYDESARFFVHKSAYVFFCLPLLGVSLGRLYQLYQTSSLRKWESFIYLLSITAVLLNFLVEKDRNGEIYAFLLVVVFCTLLLKGQLRSFSWQKITLGCLITLVPVVGAVYQFRNNPQWNSIISDAKVAVKIDQYNNWQDQARLMPPKDEEGKQISGTNYERIAWLTAALRLIRQNPQGFGLVERSFGRLGKKVWPDAKLHQSHSAWLDFTLGLGVPGIVLLLGSGILAWRNAKKIFLPWNTAGRWGLSSILLLMCTTELSQRVYIDATIFMIGFAASLGLNTVKKNGALSEGPEPLV